MFGFSVEKLDMLLLPMAVGGKEALGSMGNDAALAVLSEHPRQVNDYFKQLFAQVTNPPIDPIREEIVMSLVCPVGPEGNLLADPSNDHCKRLVIRDPVLSLEDMVTLRNTEYMYPDGTPGFKTAVIDTTFLVGSGPDGMLQVSFAIGFSGHNTVAIAPHDNFHFRRWSVFVTKLRTPSKETSASRVFPAWFCPIVSLAPIAWPCRRSWPLVLSTNTCSRPSSVPRRPSSRKPATSKKSTTSPRYLALVAMVYALTWPTRPFAR
jgi:hypothetical protein